MDILIVGAGSIGVYLGTHLRAAGHAVTLLGRKKLRKLGETIIIEGKVYEVPDCIYKMPRNTSFDFVFICSKLYDLKTNLSLLSTSNVRTPFLVSIQNGLVDKNILDAYTHPTTFGSISVFEGFRLVENQLTIARTTGGWKTDTGVAGTKTYELLKACGVNISMEESFESTKAEKTIMNCAVNLVSAIEQKTVYEICTDPRLRKTVDALFDEAYLVLSSVVPLQPREALREQFNKIIAPLPHYSSTCQDAMSGRRAEVAFLNGFILHLAREQGVSVPETQRVVAEFSKKYPKSV